MSTEPTAAPASTPAPPAAADTLFTDVYLWTGSQASPHPTDVLVRAPRIAAIGPQARASASPQARVVAGNGEHLLLPGLINAHFHSPANHLKGAFPSLPLEVFMLFESPADPALRPSPREAYLRTMLGAIEMLRGGTTAVQDDAFLMPGPDPDIVDAVMQAYADSGIRATVALDQPELAAGNREAALPGGPGRGRPARARPAQPRPGTRRGVAGRLRTALRAVARRRRRPVAGSGFDLGAATRLGALLRGPGRAERPARHAAVRAHARDQGPARAGG